MMNALIAAVSSPTLRKVPRWTAWRSMMPNHASTRFIHDADVGVKWTLIRGFGQPVSDLLLLVRGVVVHHQVQLLVRIGTRDLLEERQEFLMTVTRLALPGDLSGRDLERGEKRGVPYIVVGLPFRNAEPHRQGRGGAVQRLDLTLRAPRGAD